MNRTTPLEPRPPIDFTPGSMWGIGKRHYQVPFNPTIRHPGEGAGEQWVALNGPFPGLPVEIPPESRCFAYPLFLLSDEDIGAQRLIGAVRAIDDVSPGPDENTFPTVDELAALPTGSVILCEGGSLWSGQYRHIPVFHQGDGWWRSMPQVAYMAYVAETAYLAEKLGRPLRVLYTPPTQED